MNDMKNKGLLYVAKLGGEAASKVQTPSRVESEKLPDDGSSWNNEHTIFVADARNTTLRMKVETPGFFGPTIHGRLEDYIIADKIKTDQYKAHQTGLQMMDLKNDKDVVVGQLETSYEWLPYNGMFRNEVRDTLPKLEKTVDEVRAKLESELEKDLFDEIVQDANLNAKSLCSKLESSANVAISTDTDFGWRNAEDMRWNMLKRAWRSRKSAVRPLVVVDHPLKKHMGLNFGHDEFDTVTVTSVKTDCPSFAHGCRAMWNLCELGGVETRTFHDARRALSKIDHSASTFQLKFAPSVRCTSRRL